MSMFDECFDHTVKLEAKFYDDPKDKGGPTMYGVAYNYNKKYYKKLGITKENVKNLTLEQAKAIYKMKYWDGSGCNGIQNERKTVKTYFDMVIHAGITGAGLCFQQTINDFLPDEKDLIIDGKVGTKTMAAYNFLINGGKYDPDRGTNDENFKIMFNGRRAQYYLKMYNDKNNKNWYKNVRYFNSGIRRLK